jgi:hypothetical protein
LFDAGVLRRRAADFQEISQVVIHCWSPAKSTNTIETSIDSQAHQGNNTRAVITEEDTSMAEGKKTRVAAVIDVLKAVGVKDQHLAELQAKVDAIVDYGIHFHWHGDTGGDGIPDTFIDIDTPTFTAE